MSVKKENTIKVMLSPEKTLPLVERSLNAVDAKIRSKKETKLFAYKPTGLGLFEQQIVVSLTSTGPNLSHVQIVSESSWATNMLLAANDKNIKAFEKALQRFQNPPTLGKVEKLTPTTALIFFIATIVLVIFNIPNQHVSQGVASASSIMGTIFLMIALAFGIAILGCLPLVLVKIGWNESGGSGWRLILLLTWLLATVSIAVLFWGFELSLYAGAGATAVGVETVFLILIIVSLYQHVPWIKQRQITPMTKSDTRFMMNMGGAFILTIALLLIGIYVTKTF